MVRQILHQAEHGYDWYHIEHPTEADFHQLKTRYDLQDASITDCLEVGHLPKIEQFDNYHFLIIRTISKNVPETSDTLAELTSCICIFYGDDFIITAHRNAMHELENIMTLKPDHPILQSNKNLVNALVLASIKTFEHLLIDDLSPKLDDYEERVFFHHRRKPFLKKLYYLKRQIDLIRIILTHYNDIIDYFYLPDYQHIYTQDLRDIYSRMNTLYRNIAENTSQLLSVYFNVESNHTNEIMRTLTIISVFFMPLTFLVGVYGMNFASMPELDWRYGYPVILLLMLLISVGIYFWFKKKHWL